MDSMKRLTPAAHFRRILDIIVDEGEIMEKFQGGCRNNRIFRIASHHFAAEKNQCRPEPLPSPLRIIPQQRVQMRPGSSFRKTIQDFPENPLSNRFEVGSRIGMIFRQNGHLFSENYKDCKRGI